jgi:hypothetical protein
LLAEFEVNFLPFYSKRLQSIKIKNSDTHFSVPSQNKNQVQFFTAAYNHIKPENKHSTATKNATSGAP